VHEETKALKKHRQKAKRKQNFALLIAWLEKERSSLTKSDDVELGRQIEECLVTLRKNHKPDTSKPAPLRRTAFERIVADDDY
jgi:hypothetical protein